MKTLLFMNQKGFTLFEAILAFSLGGIFLATIVASWYFSSTVWKEESVRGKLRYDVERSMERIKNDIRLTDGNSILFYPAGESTYTAISFPTTTLNGSGFLTFSSNAIDWDKTVVYHVYQVNGKYELRKTAFNSFNDSSSARQTQLNSVVTNGQDTQGLGGVTTTIFKADSVSLAMVPSSPTFDGYDASVIRSENTSFGSVRLTPGNHTIRFEVTGKNADSSGYQLGIDTLYLTPSGGNGQEAEVFIPPNASSGDATTKEDLSAYGINLWGGNNQLAYAANAIGDYVTIQLNYDEWVESNFSNFSRNKVGIGGTDPYLTNESRESQSDSSAAWQAESQTTVEASGSASMPNKSIRTILLGTQFTQQANMVRFKFLAAPGAPLTIGSAYFGQRNGATADFTASPIPLYFDNPSVLEGDADGVGATTNPGTSTGITIPAGYHAWSNWIEYNIPASGAPNYLLSVFIPNDAANASTAVWPDPSNDNSYSVDGNQAASMVPWVGYATSHNIYATAQVAGWTATGTATSPIYDTKMTSPVYNQIKWTPVLPSGASVSVKVRSSSDPNMTGATDWSLLTAKTTSPASLGGLGNQRYLQYQFTLQAASPYASLPQADNVIIDWPGATTLVELSGYHTKKPNYGIFKILVDGVPTVKALEVKLDASDNLKDKILTASLNAEVKSRNTGK